MRMITNDWAEKLNLEFEKKYFKELLVNVEKAYEEDIVFPMKDDIFNAFHYTPLGKVKVVLLGQDPYHNVGQAHGLCFSVKKNIAIPPSLANIYKELLSDVGCSISQHGFLEKWALEGVLMLNTVLTVKAHEAHSHKGFGWEVFTDEIIRILNEEDRPIVFILWGALHGVALALHKVWLGAVPGSKILGSEMPLWRRVLGIIITFHIVCLGWLMFRVDSLDTASLMVHQIVYNFNIAMAPQVISGYTGVAILIAIGYVLHMIPTSVDRWAKKVVIASPLIVQVVMVAMMIWCVMQIKSSDIQPFIYFQF